MIRKEQGITANGATFPPTSFQLKFSRPSAELAFFDLDGFKAINDTYGHAAGDDLLQYFAKLQVRCFRFADAIGRLGGDEFVVLLGNSADCSKTGLAPLEKMAAEDRGPARQKLAFSVGTIQFDPDRHSNIESLLTDADTRMYDNKKQHDAPRMPE